MNQKLKSRLQTLTKAEKLALYDAAQEKKRRLRLTRDNYAPNSGQRTVHECPKRVRAVFAGNGSGKTAMAVQEALWALDGYNPTLKEFTKVPCRVIVVLDSPDKVAKTWLPELKKWTNLEAKDLHKDGRSNAECVRITRKNGSELLFMFHLQEEMAFESMELQYAIFDEPPPRHVFVALMRGGRTKGTKARFLIIGTPLAAPWLRTELYTPWLEGKLPDTECFRFGTDVNQLNLADNYIEDFARYLTDQEKRVRLYGEFFDTAGLALANLFKEPMHVVTDKELQWNESWPCVIAIDPHGAKPHHALLLGVDPDNNYMILGEYKSKSIPRQFAREVYELWGNGDYKIWDIIIDSYGSADLSGGDGNKSFIQVCNEAWQPQGWRGRATKYDEKSDEIFMNKIQEVLSIPASPDNFGRRRPKLRMVEQCYGTIKDIKNVEWEKYRHHEEHKPKLSIGNKDFLACLKYALATNLTYSSNRGITIRGFLGKNANRFEQSGRRAVQLNQRLINGQNDEEDDW